MSDEINPSEASRKLEINDIVLVSLIRFMVEKGVIDAQEFEEYLREVELSTFKSAPPEAIEKFGDKIKTDFDLIFELLQRQKK
ncbi:hypothetical protein IAE19_03100 [Acinetobacter sp. S40]|uniref:hypothetical protein n=1 Tax=Acinetobacter sp. S40 TaxID=2767434 RepID=UPI00190C3CC4|nr:hypothetical protein [Acinetobacter sp. S40]MBJ9984428.1 hypothetical protein [Acinetobacter sp. S40]